MLREIKTNLKSLKFGNDRPGGGDSGLPYIKTGLPENAPVSMQIALETAKFSSDYPIRGGLYSVRATAEDAIRVRKFLTDFPKGSNFTAKQVGLQKSNPLTETGKNNGRNNNQTYNLNTNLLLSVLNAGTGNNIPRPGSTPNTLLDKDNTYFSIVGKKDIENNRLVNLLKTKIQKVDVSKEMLDNLGISSDDSQIMNYPGGPDSIYGDGETTINRATNNKGLVINTQDAPHASETPKYNSLPTTASLGQNIQYPGNDITSIVKEHSGNNFDKILGINSNNEIPQPDPNIRNISPFQNTLRYKQIVKKEQYVIGTSLNDFRKDVESKDTFSRDYSDPLIPMTTRIGIGSPGARKRSNTKSINDSNNGIGQDKVNMIPIIHKNYSEAPEKEGNGDARDLIKFNFETIDNNNLDFTYRTHFRAFLKGFNDSHTADWNGKKYAGRGENMQSYQGIDRKIGFNFVISAQSKQEMKPLWQKLNYLASTLCPDYSPTNGFMRGNIHRITIGEYLYRVPGVITSMNLTVDDNYPWEIKIDQPEYGYDTDMMELPHLINVAISFTPILDIIPQTGLRQPIIMTNKVGSSFLKDDYLEKISKYR